MDLSFIYIEKFSPSIFFLAISLTCNNLDSNTYTSIFLNQYIYIASLYPAESD